MKIGTKSLLFGSHQFLIHPVCVFFGWWKLYGFPCDPRLWICFFVHDFGYWGKKDIDGEEGREHVETGAKIAGRLGKCFYNECIGHSRYYARKNNIPLSSLYYADKLAFAVEPIWLYLLLARLTGEIEEYREISESGSLCSKNVSDRVWHKKVKMFLMAKIVKELKGETA